MTAATSSTVDGSTTASAWPWTPRPIRSARKRPCGSSTASRGRTSVSAVTAASIALPPFEDKGQRSDMKRIKVVPAVVASAALALVPATQARQQATVLKGVVGPGFTITLRKSSGAKVSTLRHGLYTIMISDKSSIHNFHLTGPGVSKATGIASSGSATWKVRLKAGRYRYVCDPHADSMKGAFRVT